MNDNATTGCRTCLVTRCKREEPAHTDLKTRCRWIVELMPELVVVATREYELAVEVELLSLFVSRRA